jgi:hypothetical protein
MTQDQRPRTSSSRRAARQGHNRPTLVTSNEAQAPSIEEAAQEEVTLPIKESIAEVETQNEPIAPTKRRLPNFFSTIGKSSEVEKDAAQVRVARATARVVSSKSTKGAASEEKVNSIPAEAARPKASATPARPGGLFKTRYLLGMVIYLLSANFIGMYERSFMISQGLETNLFSIFGAQITTSTLVFLATLVAILLLLVRLDLIPRSFGAFSGQQSAARKGQGNSSETSGIVKTPPPTIRQGVKGSDDDLYHEYRANQRREKKK